jgi:uncharacterized membrane protein
MVSLKGSRVEIFRILVHILLSVYTAVLVYILLGLILNFNPSAEVFFGLSFALLFFTLAQSIYELGFVKAILFLVVTGVIGFFAEVLGTNSGFPFGKYYYTDFLGSKFLGVPVVVPLVWFVIAYLCYSIVTGNMRMPPDVSSSTKRTIFVKIALLGAFGAVAWDFMIDPMFSSYGYWVWTGQFLPLPELDGIPLTNFIGWFVLVALMIIVCLYVLVPVNKKDGYYLRLRNNSRDSIIAYVLLLVDGVVANFSLGNYTVIALGVVAMIGFLALSVRGSAKNVQLQSLGQVLK